jgi:hypothetical protein
MVPLVYDDRRFSKQIRTRLSAARRSFALYCALAEMNPLRIREPKTRKRLETSDLNQFRKRLATFLMATNRCGDLRLATREEFKAEFDRVLLSDNESAQSLGDLLNPLFGFTPAARAVFDRLLPMLRDLYSAIANDAEPFRRR